MRGVLAEFSGSMAGPESPGSTHRRRERPRDDELNVVVGLVSLVSVWGRNWFYSCGIVERVEKGEIVEIVSIHAVFMQAAEKMVGWRKRLGEYPTTRSHAHMLVPHLRGLVDPPKVFLRER